MLFFIVLSVVAKLAVGGVITDLDFSKCFYFFFVYIQNYFAPSEFPNIRKYFDMMKVQSVSFVSGFDFFLNEPPRGKTINMVSEQVWHKSACTVTEAG